MLTMRSVMPMALVAATALSATTAAAKPLKVYILLIKTSWGGKSLKLDFRPPSGGPFYAHPEEVKDRKTNKGEVITAKEEIAKKVEATGKYYRLMLEHVKAVFADPGKYCPAYDPKQGYEIAGFAWFQGFNDLVDMSKLRRLP